MNEDAAVLEQYRESVQPAWIDYNGHMSEAYYVLVFGNASDALYEQVGIGAEYRQTHHVSVYTVEAHIRYLHEVGPGSLLRVSTRVLGVDTKRVHICHEMYVESDLVATEEVLGVCVDTVGGRGKEWPHRVAAMLANVVTLERPAFVGRSVVLD
ncbi:MAG: thioesterase family protein [Gammaproteobacteria bacterium]|nr:thioesterase family protein [Gammaproteobacteria bacterium]MDH3466451.1 thioesterase family protein [Gammaproteobacteria bacterium]